MLPFASLILLAPTLLGTWSGPVTIHAPNGQDERGTAILWIGQQGDQLMGCIGDSPTHQSALRNPRADSGGLTFDFDVRSGIPMTVHLAKHGNHLTGSGRSAVTLDFDLQPTPSVHTLYEKVAELDQKLFGAYNHRDLGTIEGLFAKDLEFFHDKDGLTGYQTNMDGFRERFKETTRYRRELDLASLEVYPIKDFGAMEIGVHRFYAQPAGQPEQLVATAKFVHVWTNKDGSWKITRVVSYDHH